MPVSLEYLPPDWRDFLRDIDGGLSVPVELHCLGGFALVVLYGLERPTDDLDYISIVPKDAFDELDALAGLGSPLSKKHKKYLQPNGAIADLPESYADRLMELGPGLSRLTLKVLEPYDLTLSKLGRNGPKDREDVKRLAASRKLSFKILVERFDAEMKPWVPNVERHLLTLRLWQEYFSE
jgi:hypothetical protein